MELKGSRINVLGDSITAGHGTTDPDHTFHAVLGQLVDAAVVRNYGIGGTRIARQKGPDMYEASFAERFDGMADDADLVLVFGGTNDYGHGNAPFGTPADDGMDTFCGACRYLFRGLITKYPTATIVVMTPIHRAGDKQPTDRPEGRPLVDYVAQIRAAAEEYGLPVLDLFATAGICPDIPAQREAFCPDGLHPNNAGHAIIASRLAGFLRTL